MNAFYKRVSYVISIGFLTGIIAVIYYLYIYPDRIINVTKLVDYSQKEQLWPVLKELYLIIGAILGLGAIALVMLLLKKEDGESNVVYIEKFKEKKKRTDQQDASEELVEESELAENVRTKLESIKDRKQLAEKTISMICNEVQASQAALYLSGKEGGKNIINLFASYAFVIPESQQLSYEYGEGLAGQVAKERKAIYITDIPKGYIKILSGLGESSPQFLLIVPIVVKGQLIGVCEIASFTSIKKKMQANIEQTLNWLGGKLQEKPKKEEKKDEN